MKALKIFISIVAVLLLTLVGVGLALPGTWEVNRSLVVPAEPDEVFGLLDSVEGWSSWAAIGAVDGSISGPARGVGATLTWDSQEWGDGRWQLTEVESGRSVAYEVAVEDGAMITWGRVTLVPEGEGTRVEWTESGDFGWNPFLAYMVLGMDRMQGREMEKGLTELRLHLETYDPPPPSR